MAPGRASVSIRTSHVTLKEKAVEVAKSAVLGSVFVCHRACCTPDLDLSVLINQ